MERMPRDLQQQCLWIVRGYERCREEYAQRRQEILDSSGAAFTTYKVNGEERRAFMPGSHNVSRTTEDRELQLEGLEKMLAYRQMRAVEKALATVGRGMPELFAGKLRSAIYKNCKDGRKWSFERLHIAGVSRSAFYRYREAMLWEIANELGLI